MNWSTASKLMVFGLHSLNFLEPDKNFYDSYHCSQINWTFTFRTPNTFDRFLGVMSQIEIAKQNFPNYTMLHIHLCDFCIIHGVKQCLRITYHERINFSEYLSQFELLGSGNIRTVNLHGTKYYQTFDSLL